MPYYRSEREYDESLIERNDEYYDFLNTLENYHKRRGTLSFFMPEPAISTVKISLLRLFKEVTGKGGYDAVSCTTGLWKQMANDYGIPDMSNSGYLLKNQYYKNLAAYEIEYHWNKEPPPPNLLEHLTARGGDILQRTEEWQARKHLPPEDFESPKTSPPPQRIVNRPRLTPREFYKPHPPLPHRSLFAPLSTSFNTSAQHFSPYFATATLPPSHLTPTPIVTDPHKLHVRATEGVPLPAIGIFARPSVERIHLALKSGTKADIVWAIDALQETAFKNTDAFKFYRYPPLAESLVHLVVNGLIASNRDCPEFLFRKELYEKLEVANSAAQILRNLSLDPENASNLARMNCVHKMATLAFKSCRNPSFIELYNNILLIVEAASEDMQVNSRDDSLYLQLHKMIIDSDDRMELTAVLRILARLAKNDGKNVLFQDLSAAALDRVLLLLESQEACVMKAALELLFQFTTYKIGTDTIVGRRDVYKIIETLRRLTTFDASLSTTKIPIDLKDEHAPYSLPELSSKQLSELLQYAEPERSLRWMYLLFEPAHSDFVLQKVFVEAYDAAFRKSDQSDGSALPASELIRAVPCVFPYAQGDQFLLRDEVRSVIRGIKPRSSVGSIGKQQLSLIKWTPMKLGNGAMRYEPEIATEEERKSAEQRDLSCVFSYYLSDGTLDVPPAIIPDEPESITIEYHKTQTDQDGEPVGVALLASLILRNFIKSKKLRETTRLENDLVRVMSVNPPLNPYLADILADM